MGYSSEVLASDMNRSQLRVSFFSNGLFCSPVFGAFTSKVTFRIRRNC